MHTTALTIRTDPKTKKAVADFAASIGLSTSAFANVVLLQAIRNGQVLLTPPLEPTPYLEKIMRQADADIKAGRNISEAYDNVDDFFRDLDKTA